MNEDYLWDRSGNPDADVKEFESLLSELRFDEKTSTPPAFELSAASTRRSFVIPFALAASLTLLLTTGAVLFMHSQGRKELIVRAGVTAPSTSPISFEAGSSLVTSPATDQESAKNLAGAKNQKLKPYLHGRRHASVVPGGNATAEQVVQRRQGERIKDELIMAMRIASAKLNFAQRKVVVNKDGLPSS
jgi:hypothetical protein